jgi:ribosomal protein S1
MIEQQREDLKRRTLDGLTIGAVRKGTVKNIADFGAFIDLGGIDGLLHITDMSWGRINHPSEVLKIDQEIEVKILSIDKDKEKIALGLKQKEASPWENIESATPSAPSTRPKWSTSCPTARSAACRRASRPGAYFRDELDQADQSSLGSGHARTRR